MSACQCRAKELLRQADPTTKSVSLPDSLPLPLGSGLESAVVDFVSHWKTPLRALFEETSSPVEIFTARSAQADTTSACGGKVYYECRTLIVGHHKRQLRAPWGRGMLCPDKYSQWVYPSLRDGGHAQGLLESHHNVGTSTLFLSQHACSSMHYLPHSLSGSPRREIGRSQDSGLPR